MAPHKKRLDVAQNPEYANKAIYPVDSERDMNADATGAQLPRNSSEDHSDFEYLVCCGFWNRIIQ